MSAILRVEGVSKRFGGIVALNKVSLEVREGEFLGIIGPNGSGKTTLFNIITGFIKPDEGRVIYMGRDITRLPPHRIARMGIARTFQIMKPLENLSVMDNLIAYALPRSRNTQEARARALEVLDLVELRDRKDLLARELNAAEKRRLELARAIISEPRVLLLDEVLAGLSPSEVDRSLELLKRIHMKGITIVMIEHVMRAIMRASQRVVVLNYGRIIAEGPPEKVSRDPNVIEAYLGSSTQRYTGAAGHSTDIERGG